MKQSKKQLELLQSVTFTEQKIELDTDKKSVDFQLHFSPNYDAIPPTRTLVTALRNSSSIPIATANEPISSEFKRNDTLAHKTEIELIKNRHVLDPKRHYKKLDKITHFQVGKIIDQRGTLVSEMQSDRYKSYVDRRLSEIHVARNHVTRKGRKWKKKW
jgi:hypothetical protein